MIRPRPWQLLAVAAGLLAFVLALLAWSTEPGAGTGFEVRQYLRPTCEGDAQTSIVREPYVHETEYAEARCLQWTAQMVVRSKMRARVEITQEGGATVSIDGKPVVTDQGAHPARTRAGTVELARGVHVFATQYRAEKGPAYLRIALVDELEPHNFEFAPPLDEGAFFPSSEDASRALQLPAPLRSKWPALFAYLALAGVAACAWLALRVRRGKEVPWLDVGVAAAIVLAGTAVRVHALALQDTTWDELTYVDTAAHWLRNLALGDYHPEAWRFNLAHPPDTKWLLAPGVALAGQGGARVASGVVSAVAAALLFAFGRVAFGRAVGAVAGALAVFLPLWVAHGRIAGHESVMLLWWCAAMLALACWLRSLEEPGADVERGDPWAAFACVFAATIGVLSRVTFVWIVPLLVVVLVVRQRRAIARGVLPLPVAAIAGGVAALALTFAGWPYLWRRPYDQLAHLAAMAEVGGTRGDIEVYLGKLTTPAWHYFPFAFVAETPALLVAAGFVGAVLVFRGRERMWGAVCLLWLVVPFLQGVSSLRIGAARYVIQAWPALLLFAAVALVALGRRAADLVASASPRVRSALRAAPAVVVVAYTARALLVVEPYPLDYFGGIVGGPAHVAATQMFEVPWWGEGNLAAVRALDEKAPQGARVHLSLWPKHALARLRDDLVQVDDATLADYDLVSHLQYFAKPAPGCALESSVQVAGAPLVDTYRCTPVSPADLGFAAMHDPSKVDEAIGHFNDALKLDPHSPGAVFGLGWAAQVKGDGARAESLYLQAAGAAARANDADTEYFSRFNLGTLYLQHGLDERAADAFRGALVVSERAPERFADGAWHLWADLGTALAGAGHTSEARAAFEHALALQRDEPSVVAALQKLNAPPADAGAPDGATSSGPRGAPRRR